MAVILTGMHAQAVAELHDRGGGLIYDDVLDVTWLQDANYALTSGAHPNGRMSWALATQWTQNLYYYDSVRDITWGDWRLPHTLPVNGVSYNDVHEYDGSSDFGFNISSPNSELGYMFHINLHGTSYTDVNGNWPQPNYGLNETGPFLNLGPVGFWSGTEFDAFDGHAWGFVFMTGSQHHGAKVVDQFFAWPVRDGDVAAGPLPEVNIISPTPGSSVSGLINIYVNVANMDVKRVIMVAAGVTLCGDTQPPFVCRWDTTGLANGTYLVQVTAVDNNTNQKKRMIVVGVNN